MIGSRTRTAMRRRLTMACLCLSASVAIAAPGSDDALAFIDEMPRIGNAVTASRAPIAAWWESHKGVRTLWATSAAHAAGLALHTYASDDGIAVSDLALSADGRALIYVRGSASRHGGALNPQLLADPQQFELNLLRTDSTNAPVNLWTDRRRPAGFAIAPDGESVAVSLGDQVIRIAFANASERQKLFTLPGRLQSLTWSPDGSTLAFVSSRGTHSFVGLFDVRDRRVRILQPSIDHDLAPAFSPDGTKLAFARSPAPVQGYRFTPRLSGNPWGIRVVDVRSGSLLHAWDADAGPGSAMQGTWPDERVFAWESSNSILFVWEKTGWLRLYRLGLESRVIAPLSPDGAEVTDFHAAANRVLFAANVASAERYEIFSLTNRQTAAKRCERDRKLFANAFDLASDGTAYVAAYGEHSAIHMRSIDASCGESRAMGHTPSPVYQKAKAPTFITVTAQDGFRTRAAVFMPEGRAPARGWPAIVYAHGGSRQQALAALDWADDSYFHQTLLAAGYAVVVPSYRSGTGYGLQFREAASYGGGGATDTLDIIAAGRWLQSQPQIDRERLGIYGDSYGGYLVTAVLAKAPEIFAAGASVVGVADWQMEMELDSAGAPLPLRLSERMQAEDLAFRSSANASLEAWRAPILFVTADDDTQGWMAQTVELGQRLRARGIPVEVSIWPGGPHTATVHAEHLQRFRRSWSSSTGAPGRVRPILADRPLATPC